MCNCRNEIAMLENFTSKTGELAERVELDVAVTVVNDQFRVITKTTAKVDYPSKKRPVAIPVLHNFCPWCGEKYDKEPSFEENKLLTAGIMDDKQKVINLLQELDRTTSSMAHTFVKMIATDEFVVIDANVLKRGCKDVCSMANKIVSVLESVRR